MVEIVYLFTILIPTQLIKLLNVIARKDVCFVKDGTLQGSQFDLSIIKVLTAVIYKGGDSYKW